MPTSGSLDPLATQPTLTKYRNTALTSTKQSVQAAATALFRMSCINVNNYPVYLKFYDALVANVTVGTTVPVLTVAVPMQGYEVFNNTGFPIQRFAIAMVVAVVQELADSGTTTPATAVHFGCQHLPA